MWGRGWFLRNKGFLYWKAIMSLRHYTVLNSTIKCGKTAGKITRVLYEMLKASAYLIFGESGIWNIHYIFASNLIQDYDMIKLSTSKNTRTVMGRTFLSVTGRCIYEAWSRFSPPTFVKAQKEQLYPKIGFFSFLNFFYEAEIVQDRLWLPPTDTLTNSQLRQKKNIKPQLEWPTKSTLNY